MTFQSSRKHILLTGLPGVGKTTLVRKLCDELQKNDINICGFYTSEVSNGSRRLGFDVYSFGECQQNAKLARLTNDREFLERYKQESCPQVGKYSVFLNEFEAISLPIFDNVIKSQTPVNSKTVFVVDEIGKMECFSSKFKEQVKKLFANNSNSYIVLATVPLKSKGLNIVDDLKRNQSCRLITVTLKNRDDLLPALLKHFVQNQ